MNFKGKKIIITGGAGFIGSHIAESLVRSGARVTVYDNLSTGKAEYLRAIRKNINFVRGDVLDSKKLKKACRGMDAISHQAAQLEIYHAIKDPEFDLRVNTIGTLNVLRAAKELKIKKVINASSVSVYGQALKVPQRETDATDPNWAYGVSKLAAEKYCSIFNEQYGIPMISLRYGQVYGAREWFGRALTVFIKRMFDKKPIVIFGSGKQVRDYIYVSDVVDCHNICLGDDKIKNGIYNVGSGRGLTILKIAAAVKNVFADKSRLIFEDTREGEISRHVKFRRRIPCELKKMYMSVEKAASQLKWKPKIMLSEGIKREVRWLKKTPSAWKIKGVVEI